MRYFFILILLFICNLSLAEGKKSIEKVDFDVSMGSNTGPMFDFMFRHPDSAKYYHTFKTIFNNNFYKNPNQKLQIPKIIHQLWIGPNPLPKFFQSYIKTCKEANPGWEYKLWTEKELEKIFYNKEALKALNVQLNVSKDYLMHIILSNFGGVFLDVDYACFKPFDQLNYKYDAWFALEPSGWWKKIPATSYSIIAAKPDHPIILDTVREIERYALDKNYRINHNKEYTDKGIKNDKIFGSIQLLEGINIHKYCQYNNCNNIMVFPTTYFLPKIDANWLLDNLQKYSLLDKIKIHLGGVSYKIPYFEIKPETIAMNDFNAKAKINPLYYKETYYNGF